MFKMGKTNKLVVCGMKSVGKTTLLEQLIYGTITEVFFPTIEDIYVAHVESDRGTRERLRLYDTAGIDHTQISNSTGTTNQQLPRHFLAIADGYVLVYDTEKQESVDVLITLKKDIDRNKDKKEVTIIVLGNRTKEESSEFESVSSRAGAWCTREKIRHFIVSAKQRQSLYEPFVYLASRLNPPPSKTTFPQLTMGRKVSTKDTSS